MIFLKQLPLIYRRRGIQPEASNFHLLYLMAFKQHLIKAISRPVDMADAIIEIIR